MPNLTPGDVGRYSDATSLATDDDILVYDTSAKTLVKATPDLVISISLIII